MDRNDSRKSKSKEKGSKTKGGEEPDDEPRKSSGLVRAKPCREIYRPPSVRKEGKQFSGESSGKFHSMNQNSQIHGSRQTNTRQLNVHAKEFTFPTQIMPPQAHHNYYGNMSSGYYPGEGGPNSPLYNSRCFPLQQSKSSGNVGNYFHLWNHQQQAQRQMAYQQQQESTYYGLQQSKSSGNIIANGGNHHGLQNAGKNGKIVRFDFSSSPNNPSEELRESVKATMADNRMAKLQRELEMTKESFATLNIDGDNDDRDCRLINPEYDSIYASPRPASKFSHSKNQLQKSISTFYVPNSIKEPSSEDDVTRKVTHVIKRSNSFIPKSSIRNGSANGASAQLPNYLITNIDLDIKKWPKNIQESVTTSVINGEKIPARHRISMVAKILDILLLVSEEGKDNLEIKSSKYKQNRANLLEMLPSAVNIFLYFIQREKDRTIMETVLNSCFATYQKLQKTCSEKLKIDQEDESVENSCWNEDKIILTLIPRQWYMLLNLVSSMYTKVKVMRTQNHQHPGYKALDELKNAMMSLLCDCCLVTLRTAPLQSSEIMDLLFTIMTSIGRDMEACHPTKMKQILASVRDVLLGIKPYGGGSVEAASPGVQKTLMQLIELHAANWHLPASAVRYYYYQPM